MAVKIRLTRAGAKGHPFYRIIAAEDKSPRDGKFLEVIGTYNPLNEPPEVKINKDLALRWIGNGATPTPTARKVLELAEVLKPKVYKAKANAKAATPRPKKKDAKKGK
jgi:small subunit ribosomal protein S16